VTCFQGLSIGTDGNDINTSSSGQTLRTRAMSANGACLKKMYAMKETYRQKKPENSMDHQDSDQSEL
jgi:hypothetical protein